MRSARRFASGHTCGGGEREREVAGCSISETRRSELHRRGSYQINGESSTVSDRKTIRGQKGGSAGVADST